MMINKPTVLVLLNGGMLSIQKEKETVPAIIEVEKKREQEKNKQIILICNDSLIFFLFSSVSHSFFFFSLLLFSSLFFQKAGYPGMRGAEAIAMTIFGLNDHLGGKLPYTIYPSDYVGSFLLSFFLFSYHSYLTVSLKIFPILTFSFVLFVCFFVPFPFYFPLSPFILLFSFSSSFVCHYDCVAFFFYFYFFYFSFEKEPTSFYFYFFYFSFYSSSFSIASVM